MITGEAPPIARRGQSVTAVVLEVRLRGGELGLGSLLLDLGHGVAHDLLVELRDVVLRTHEHERRAVAAHLEAHADVGGATIPCHRGTSRADESLHLGVGLTHREAVTRPELAATRPLLPSRDALLIPV